jgi:hypothetical protein
MVPGGVGVPGAAVGACRVGAVGGRGACVDPAAGEEPTSGNVGLPKRYWFLSSFMAAVAATMNCRQIGAA